MTNQALSKESKPPDRTKAKVGIQEVESQLPKRIREAIGEDRVATFGRRCGVGESTLRKYLDGALPNVVNLVAIADAANVEIAWLAAGRGPKQRGASVAPTPPPAPAPAPEPAPAPAPFDVERLARAIGAVQEGLRAVNRALPPDKHAKLIQAAYNLLGRLEASDKLADQAITKARDQVIDFIKLAA